MWYLIAPPFIVVLLMAFLVWFLAKRASEPSVLERMESLSRRSDESGSAILRVIRQYGLQFLDRATHVLKVLSLRAHNAFHSASQGIKRKRKSLLERKIETTEPTREQAGSSDVPAEKKLPQKEQTAFPFFARRRKLTEEKLEEVDSKSLESYLQSENTHPETSAASPVDRSTALPDTVPKETQTDTEATSSRPMVTEAAAVPEELEQKRERDRENALRENALIKKIAANPKSVSAYEALGDFYLEMGNVNDAKSCYKQVLKLSPVHRSVKMKIRRLERMIEERG